jgi:hypothetical protein
MRSTVLVRPSYVRYSARVVVLILCTLAAASGCSGADDITAPTHQTPSLQQAEDEWICVRKGDISTPSDTAAVLPDGSCAAGYDHTPWW